MNTATSFEERLEASRFYVSHTADVLRARKLQVIDVDADYEPFEHDGRAYGGPSIDIDGTRCPYPDLKCYARGRFHWIEVKHRSGMWMNQRGVCVFAMPVHSYERYRLIEKTLGAPVWLLIYCEPHRVAVAASSRASARVPSGCYAMRVSRMNPASQAFECGEAMLHFDLREFHNVTHIFGDERQWTLDLSLPTAARHWA